MDITIESSLCIMITIPVPCCLCSTGREEGMGVGADLSSLNGTTGSHIRALSLRNHLHPRIERTSPWTQDLDSTSRDSLCAMCSSRNRPDDQTLVFLNTRDDSAS